ncbi:MAG: hypothetical protein AAFO63_13935 [Pseudomonadota bacterium]
MRLMLCLLVLSLGACATSPGPIIETPPVGMRYSHDGFSVDEDAERAHHAFEQTLERARHLIAQNRPAGAPITLVYVNNTLNLVDTPTSFTRDMGAAEAPTARIAATQQYRGSGLRVIDPEHFSADMGLDCQNAENGARVFQLRTYVSNYDPAVLRIDKGVSPFLDGDEGGFDYSRQSGSTTDVFTIDTELTDCFGNVLRALSPVVEVSAVTKGDSVFFFSEFFGLYANKSLSFSSNLNGAKKRGIELVVAEIGLYMAGVPDAQISDIFAPKPQTAS